MSNDELTNKYLEKIKGSFVLEEKSFVGFFIKHFRFTYLMIIIIVFLGVFSMLTMPKESEPEVKVPFAVVNTVYPGATPADIEELVTAKLEDRIKNLDNLKVFNSSSNESFSSIFVEFEAEANLKDSFQKLRDAVAESENELPGEAETPKVTEINFNDFPVVTYSLIGNYSDEDLKIFADIVQEKFEEIKDISRATIIGGLKREFQVKVNQTKLLSYNLSLGQIIGSIQKSNFNLPSGDIEVDGFKYNVRVKGKILEASELENTVIATYNDSSVFIKDVAQIIDGYQKKNSESLIGLPNEDPKNTISLQIFKKTGGNILNIADNAQTATDELFQNKKLPQDLKVLKTNDNSVFIKDDLKTLGTSAVQTVILITLILFMVLSLRGAIITALSVPLAFLTTFIFLSLQGMTLNGMVLFSLVLSLGLMVDNAIVIIEGINEYVNKYKKSIYEAAILSVWNFKWAITAGTLTTVAAFMPMLLVSGILGEYMSVLPKTISVTLLSSLFVALIVIPTLATRFIKTKTGSSHRNKKRHIYIESKMNILHLKYRNLLQKILLNKSNRRKSLAAIWILFFISLAIPLSGLMKIEMFPQIDIAYFIVNIELPVGSTLDKTKDVTMRAIERIKKIPELDNYVANIGSSLSVGFDAGTTEGAHLAHITVNLVDKNDRKRRSYVITEDIRPIMESIQGGNVRVEELAAGPPTGAPIEVRIFSESLEDLSLITESFSEYFKKKTGVINIKDSVDDSTGEFIFNIDKQKANYYSLDVASIASTLRTAIYGTKASEISVNGDDVEIIVKYSDDTINNINDIKNIRLPTPKGGTITLGQISKTDIEPSLLSIKHRDGKKIATISASIEKEVNLQKILNNFENDRINIIKNLKLNSPEDLTIKVGGEVEDIQKSFQELFLSMILSVILIALILVLQFNSFKQPLIIIFSLPLAVIGVILGLNLMMHPFSFTVFIGLVSLSGIVVNDSIVLIDRINKNIINGMDFFEAIIDGGIARMQPIFLTSLTTIVGILPLIYASELWRGFSITLIFGLMFSTVLTLVIIPIYYASICQKECRDEF